jgi:hypothetical protein
VTVCVYAYFSFSMRVRIAHVCLCESVNVFCDVYESSVRNCPCGFVEDQVFVLTCTCLYLCTLCSFLCLGLYPYFFMCTTNVFESF